MPRIPFTAGLSVILYHGGYQGWKQFSRWTSSEDQWVDRNDFGCWEKSHGAVQCTVRVSIREMSLFFVFLVTFAWFGVDNPSTYSVNTVWIINNRSLTKLKTTSLKYVLSLYSLYGAVCLQLTQLSCDDRENVYFILLSSSNRKYESLTIV